jgi:hypothetical protein
MRFSYDVENNELSIYVKRNEFDLAANDTEYRVFKRVFNRENLELFLKSYSNFIKDIFSYITPDEPIHEIVAISQYKQLYSWRSLTEMVYGDESSSFLENLMIYGLSVMDKECKKVKEKTIMESIHKRDKNKLSLIMTLIDTLTLPMPYMEGKKSKNNAKALQTKLNTMDKKLKVFEEKYGFDSQTAWKYYNDDKFVGDDDNMLNWLELYEEKNYILSIDKKRQLAEELVSKWMQDING